jgi:TolA-binding protein
VTSGASKGRRRTLPSKSGSDQGDVVTATADAPEQHSVDVTPPKTNPSKSDSDVEADLSAPNPEKATPKALQGSTRVAAEASASVLPNRSAAELFSEANEARRRGDIERARWLYRTLRETHPTAKESLLSHALLARFELQHGAATAALLEFDQYLRLAPAGPLAEESLEGRATAYRQLGMHAQESMAWRELLNRFPGSVYARTAKERMRDLR